MITIKDTMNILKQRKRRKKRYNILNGRAKDFHQAAQGFKSFIFQVEVSTENVKYICCAFMVNDYSIVGVVDSPEINPVNLKLLVY